jgi:hypothetical protein
MSSSFLLLNEKAQVSNITFGLEKQPLLKVDSYLTDPQVLIDYAIKKNEFVPAGNFYPGIRMPVPISYTKALFHNLRNEIERTFNVDLTRIKTAVSDYSIITKTKDKLGFEHTIPHFDGFGKNKLAVLHYLCDFPDSGTAFYRHKELGYEYIDNARGEKYLSLITNQFSDKKVFDRYICNDTEEFEKIASFQCMYNRLLIYKASSLHSGIIQPDFTFDSSPATGRLTISSFIEFNE